MKDYNTAFKNHILKVTNEMRADLNAKVIDIVMQNSLIEDKVIKMASNIEINKGINVKQDLQLENFGKILGDCQKAIENLSIRK